MARSRVKVLGLDELARVLEGIPRDIRERDLHRETKKGADTFRDMARNLAPVRTGKLRSNIVTRKNKGTAFDAEHEVVVRARGKAGGKYNAFYGAFVEYGTRNMAARPFMRPAFDLLEGDVVRNFKKAVLNRVRRYARRARK